MNLPKKYTRNPRALRLSLGLNQAQFWNPLGVTQSGGSRYESGRKMPTPVILCLIIAYATRTEAQRLIFDLRSGVT